jgi:hypothetical protein
MYNPALTDRGINIVESDFDLKGHIRYFTFGHSIYGVFRTLLTTFCFRSDSLLLKLIVKYICNLALTRRGLNIIESEFDLKELVGYFTLEHSIYRVYTP